VTPEQAHFAHAYCRASVAIVSDLTILTHGICGVEGLSPLFLMSPSKKKPFCLAIFKQPVINLAEMSGPVLVLRGMTEFIYEDCA
jgi:hypothetical protein